MLLERCEREACVYGFTRLEMMATLPGVRLYAARGYVASTPVEWPLGDGLSIRFVPMSKPAAALPWRIERANPDDAPEILALQKLAFESEARLYEDWTMPPLIQTLEALRAEFAESIVLKALEAGRVVGSVRARLEAGTCQVVRLAVLPRLQGCGLGTRMMREIDAAFPAAARFELFTGSRSAGNIRLYERLGFRRCREQVLSAAVTLVFMEKKR